MKAQDLNELYKKVSELFLNGSKIWIDEEEYFAFTNGLFDYFNEIMELKKDDFEDDVKVNTTLIAAFGAYDALDLNPRKPDFLNKVNGIVRAVANYTQTEATDFYFKRALAIGKVNFKELNGFLPKLAE